MLETAVQVAALGMSSLGHRSPPAEGKA